MPRNWYDSKLHIRKPNSLLEHHKFSSDAKSCNSKIICSIRKHVQNLNIHRYFGEFLNLTDVANIWLLEILLNFILLSFLILCETNFCSKMREYVLNVWACIYYPKLKIQNNKCNPNCFYRKVYHCYDIRWPLKSWPLMASVLHHQM